MIGLPAAIHWNRVKTNQQFTLVAVLSSKAEAVYSKNSRLIGLKEYTMCTRIRYRSVSPGIDCLYIRAPI